MMASCWLVFSAAFVAAFAPPKLVPQAQRDYSLVARLKSPAPRGRGLRRRLAAREEEVDDAPSGPSRNLGIGVRVWTEIRELNLPRVDKTRFAAQLAQRGSRRIFTRPRRQGKSSLLDQVSRMLQGRRDLFTGTDAENILDDDFWSEMPRPVIRLDMSVLCSTEGPDCFKAELRKMLADVGKAHGIDPGCITHAYGEKLSPHQALENLIVEMRRKGGGKTVGVLIDEYDAPLVRVLDANGGAMQENVEHIRKVLNYFFAVLKKTQEDTWCQLVTGSTKFVVGASLSGADLYDESNREKFALATGFTREEIEETYGPELGALLGKVGGTAEELWATLDRHYGGLSYFDGAVKLYNTWDIVEALTSFDLDLHWAKTPGAAWLSKVALPQMGALMPTARVLCKTSAASDVDMDAAALAEMTTPSIEPRIDVAAWALQQAGVLAVAMLDDERRPLLHVPNKGAARVLQAHINAKWRLLTSPLPGVVKLREAYFADDVPAMMRASGNLTVALYSHNNFYGERSEVNIMRLHYTLLFMALQAEGAIALSSELSLFGGRCDLLVVPSSSSFAHVLEGKAVEEPKPKKAAGKKRAPAKSAVQRAIVDATPQVLDYRTDLEAERDGGTRPELKGRTVCAWVVVVLRSTYGVAGCQEVGVIPEEATSLSSSTS